MCWFFFSSAVKKKHHIDVLYSHFILQKYRSGLSHTQPAFSGTCDSCGAIGSDEERNNLYNLKLCYQQQL